MARRFKIGDKVAIPETKYGERNFRSAVVKEARELKNDFLYYAGRDKKSGRPVCKDTFFCLLSSTPIGIELERGDFFYESELKPYNEKSDKNKKLNLDLYSTSIDDIVNWRNTASDRATAIDKEIKKIRDKIAPQLKKINKLEKRCVDTKRWISSLNKHLSRRVFRYKKNRI